MYFAACPQIIAALHWRYAPIKNTSNLPPVTGPSHQATRMRGIFLGRLNAARNRLSDLPKGSIAFSTPVILVGKTEITTKAGCLRSKLLKSFDVRILSIGNKYCKKNISQS